MAGLYHNETENLMLQVAGSLNRANSMAFLTDAGVAAADTRAGLLSFIDSVVVHNDQENWKTELKQAIVASPITDADILSLTTVAGLIAVLPVSQSNNLILA
jgi:hypothetical protein